MTKGAREPNALSFAPRRFWPLPQCQSGTIAWAINAVRSSPLVMPGPVPGIHAFATAVGDCFERVDGRDKPGHDVL